MAGTSGTPSRWHVASLAAQDSSIASTAALLLRFHANILIAAKYLKVWSDGPGAPASELLEEVYK